MSTSNFATSKKIVIYARVSTLQQTPDMQLQQLHDHAGQRGWEVVGEFVDHGVSGASDRRPELDRMMTIIRTGGRVDAVCVWRFDRFARSVRHLVDALAEFNARSIDFISISDGIDTTTPMGRFAHAVPSSRTC